MINTKTPSIMKKKVISMVMCSTLLVALFSACNRDITGCTDSNADNYASKANKNADCRYRYASNIDISGVSSTRPDGTAWDAGDNPDVKVNFGKKSSSGYSYSTNTASNASSSSTVTPSSTVKFSNEDWKYEIVDVDALGNEVMSTGIFNPITDVVTDNTITVINNGITIKFKYTIQ